MSSAINKLFRHADMFGQPIAMTFSRKEKVKTTFGGVCSILFCLFVAWAIYNGSQNLIFKNNPKIIVTESFTENPRAMLLTEDNFPLAFAMQAPDDLYNVEYLDNDIFKLEFVVQKFTRTIQPDGTKNVVLTETPIDLETCTLSHFGSMADSFKYFNLEKMFCISRSQTYIDKIQLEGNYDSLLYVAIAVRVLECNDTAVGNTCKSASVRQSYLAGAYFNVIYTNMVVDSKNYHDPNSRFRDLYYTMINQKEYKRSYVQLQHVNVTTDSGWLIEDTETNCYVKVGNTKEFTQNVDDPKKTLLSVTLQVGKLEEIYTRSYDKIQNIFADVGGIVSAVFVIVFLILAPYTKLKLREALMNELFNIYQAPKSGGKKSKEVQEAKTLDLGSQAEQESINLKAGKSEDLTPISNAKVSSMKTLRDDTPSTTSRYNNANQRAKIAVKTRPQYPPTNESSGLNSSRNVIKPKGPTDWREAYTGNESPIFFFGKTADETYRGPKRQEATKKSTRPGQISPDFYSSVFTGAQTSETPDSGKSDLQMDVESISTAKTQVFPVKEENVTIHITFLEFIISKIYKTNSMKKKMELIDNGIKSINERLDVINVMKKLREVDKLKVLFLDDHQFALFNHLPKPEIRPKELKTTERAFMLGLLASLKFIDGDEADDIVHKAYQRVSNKLEMTEIDRKLLEIFDKKSK